MAKHKQNMQKPPVLEDGQLTDRTMFTLRNLQKRLGWGYQRFAIQWWGAGDWFLSATAKRYDTQAEAIDDAMKIRAAMPNSIIRVVDLHWSKFNPFRPTNVVFYGWDKNDPQLPDRKSVV